MWEEGGVKPLLKKLLLFESVAFSATLITNNHVLISWALLNRCFIKVRGGVPKTFGYYIFPFFVNKVHTTYPIYFTFLFGRLNICIDFSRLNRKFVKSTASWLKCQLFGRKTVQCITFSPVYILILKNH